MVALTPEPNYFWTKSAAELRDTWQARVLAAAKGKTWRVAVAALAMDEPAKIPYLFNAIYHGFKDVERPFLAGYAVITKAGKVICGVVRSGSDSYDYDVIYDSEDEMIGEFRRLADVLKLDDADRAALFEVLRKWVAADQRINVMGEKVLH